MTDPWRKRCPEGHASWLRRDGFYYCEVCQERFDELVDAARLDQATAEGGVETDALPDPPFAAGQPRTAEAYHTTRCETVVQQSNPERIRTLTDNEIDYHGLTHCRHCRRRELSDLSEQFDVSGGVVADD